MSQQTNLNQHDRESFPIPAPLFSGIGRRVEAGEAFAWLQQGWALFLDAPLFWLPTMCVLLLVVMTLMFVPAGKLAVSLLAPMIAAMMLEASRCLVFGGRVTFSVCVVRLSGRVFRLLQVGALMTLVLSAVITLVFGAYYVGYVRQAEQQGLLVGLIGLGCALLLLVILCVPLLMATWFAPALVVFNDMGALSAIKASFEASRRNVPALAVLALAVFVLAILALLPGGLGLPVLCPVVAGAAYVSYRDVFLAD